MAINLRKEAYQKEQSSENNAQPIREGFPTYDDTPYNRGNVGEDGEIYPVREIYPKPPPMNIVNEEETADEPPEENYPTASPVRKRSVIRYAACVIAFIAAGAFLWLSFSGTDSSSDSEGFTVEKYVCGIENAAEIVINAEDIYLNIEYEDNTDNMIFSALSCHEVTISESTPDNSGKASVNIELVPYNDNGKLEPIQSYFSYGNTVLTLPNDFDGRVRLMGGEAS